MLSANRTRSHQDALSRRFVRKKLWTAIVSAGYSIPGVVSAAPLGEVIIDGQATITRPDAQTTVVEQSTQNSIINWNSFSIANQEFVRYIQPNANAISLNRVTGGQPSEILGNLSANGQVFLVNTHGVYFGPGSQVDVAGLVATTLDISDQDFKNHHYVFANGNGGNVTNEGRIRTRPGGYSVLAGERVVNKGRIDADLGQIALVSGSKMTMSVDANGLISVAVDDAALSSSAGVINDGVLSADGGRILVSARVADHLVSTAVNNTGLIEASSIVEANGEIYLVGDGGNVVNSGTIVSDSLADGRTGRVELRSSNDIDLSPTSVISASGANDGVFDGGEIRLIADGSLIMQPGSLTRVEGGAMGGNGGFLELSGAGGLRLDGRYSGRTYQDGYQNGSLYIDPQNIRIATGGTVIGSGSLHASSGSSLSTLTIDPNMSGGAWSNVSLFAQGNITLDAPLADSDLPSGGSLSLGAGSSINISNFIGSQAAPFNHSVTMTANGNIRVAGAVGGSGAGIYLGGANALSLVADADHNGLGDVVVESNDGIGIVSATTGNISISGANLSVLGGTSSIAAYALIQTASGDISINTTNGVRITGGSALHGSNTSAGDVSAKVLSGNNIDITTGSGGIVVQGGIGTIGGATAPASVDASAILAANNNLTINGTGDIAVNGGSAQASASTSFAVPGGSIVATGAGAIEADADGNQTGTLTIVNDGSLTLRGAQLGALSGSASAHAYGSASVSVDASAKLSGYDVVLDVGGAIALNGGVGSASATATAGSSASASAVASTRIVAERNVSIDTGRISQGDITLTAGSAHVSASGSGNGSADANGDAQISAGNDVAITLSSGSLTVVGGAAYAVVGGTGSIGLSGQPDLSGNASAAAGIVADGNATGSGTITLTSANAVSLIGGTSGSASAANGGSSWASAVANTGAAITGQNIVVNTNGNLTLQGGSGSAAAQGGSGTSVYGYALYQSNAEIKSADTVAINIAAGNLSLTGGSSVDASASGASGDHQAIAQADATIESTAATGSLSVTINVHGSNSSGNVSLDAGGASAGGTFGGSGSSANNVSSATASASILGSAASIAINVDNSLALRGGSASVSPSISGASASGSAEAFAQGVIRSTSGAVTVQTTSGDISLNTADGGSSHTTAGSVLIAHDTDAEIGGTQVAVTAGRDLIFQTNLLNGDLATNGSLTLSAGRDLNLDGNIGTAAQRFAHDVTLNADNDVNIGRDGAVNLYLGANTLNLNGDVDVNGAGKVLVTGQHVSSSIGTVVVDTQGSLNITGASVEIRGDNSSAGYALVHATGNINAHLSGGMLIKGGSASASSTDILDVSAGMSAGGNVGVTVDSGSLSVLGGSAYASISGNASSSASANASAYLTAGGNVTLDVGGAVNVTGGVASATASASSGSSLVAMAEADARISAGSSAGTLTVNAGSLGVRGGTADAYASDGSSSGVSSINGIATATGVLTARDLVLNIAGNMVVRGGSATAVAGAASSGVGAASADASVSLSGAGSASISLTNNGQLTVLGGTANAGSNAALFLASGTASETANASASLTFGQVDITTAGATSVSGGTVRVAGDWSGTSASAAAYTPTARAQANIVANNGNVSITSGNGISIQGGSATNMLTLASSGASGLGSGSASMDASVNITATGVANVTNTGGSMTWVSGSSQSTDLVGGTLQKNNLARIVSGTVNIDTPALYIDAGQDLSLGSGTYLTVGSGTTAGVSGDSGLPGALTRNLLPLPDTMDPNLFIRVNGALTVDDLTLTGVHPYAWLEASNTTVNSLTLPNASHVTFQYSPYDPQSAIGIHATSAGSALSGSDIDYVAGDYAALTAGLGVNSTLIIGSSQQTGAISIGADGDIDIGAQNIGVFVKSGTAIGGLNHILTTGTVFTLETTAATGFVEPVVHELVSSAPLDGIEGGYYEEERKNAALITFKTYGTRQ